MDKEIIVYVIPNWEVGNEHSFYFNVSIMEHCDGQRGRKVLYDSTVDDSKLVDIISYLAFYANDKNIDAYIFANYNGNEQLIKFYDLMIENFEKGNFHMEYEWG